MTIPFELQEVVAFIDGARLGARRPRGRRSTSATRGGATELERTSRAAGYADDANEGGEVVASRTVEAAHERARETSTASSRRSGRSRRRGRLRPGRHLARPDGGRGLGRRVRPGRAGAADRLRASSSSAPRSSCGRSTPSWRRGRGADLVRRPRRRRARRADRLRRADPRDPRDPARARRGARRGAGEDRRRRQRRDRDHQRRHDRLPRGPRGDPDRRRDHRLDGRRQPPAAAAGLSRRPAGAAGQRAAVRRRPAGARLALAVRRAARGRRRRGRDRGAAAGHELVLPPRLLDRVDLEPPQARHGAARRRRRPRRRRRHGRRPLPARLHQRPPRGLRDRALPAGAAAQLRDRDRRRRGRARPARRPRSSASRPSCSSASCPTRRC